MNCGYLLIFSVFQQRDCFVGPGRRRTARLLVEWESRPSSLLILTLLLRAIARLVPHTNAFLEGEAVYLSKGRLSLKKEAPF